MAYEVGAYERTRDDDLEQERSIVWSKYKQNGFLRGLCVWHAKERLSFSTPIHSIKGTLHYIHSDLWGSSRVPSKDNSSHYMLSLIDDFSRII